MILRELLKSYDLHDSAVNNIRYMPEQKEVVIELILSNWRQPTYVKGDAEFISGRLIFTNVKRYNINPDAHNFDEDEIISAKILPTENDKGERLQFVLLAMSFPDRKEDIKIVEIEAKDVSWQMQ